MKSANEASWQNGKYWPENDMDGIYLVGMSKFQWTQFALLFVSPFLFCYDSIHVCVEHKSTPCFVREKRIEHDLRKLKSKDFFFTIFCIQFRFMAWV